MITLKHLTVERFRLLRELNLHFPQRGSILIQGPNESGKSALLESMYFALYGEPLVAGRGSRSLDDLILYGATNATVTLSLAVGATELTIIRTIERGQGQKVSLQVRRQATADELITDVAEANQRIVAEVNAIDGKALRNSVLIEQKGLARLETISGAEREETVRKLLGLEQLSGLAERFQLTESDEQLLHEANEQLRLAEIQQRIPELSRKLEEIEIALDAVSVHEKLAEINQQEAEIGEQEQALEDIQKRRQDLRSRLGRAQQLKRADTTLAEIITSYEKIAEARHEIPELEKQIAELGRREQEELPVLQKRVNELAELTQSFGTLQRMSNDLLTAVDTIKELEQELKQHDAAEENLRSLDEQVAQARMRLEQAKQALQDLEERRSAGRPLLEARLERMQNLAERLRVLKQLEEQYARRLASKAQAEENSQQLKKVNGDLRDTEQELSLVEAEARQVQQQADEFEQRWRKISIRRQVEEWQRLMGLSQGLINAEQHLYMARQQHALNNQALMDARNKVSSIMIRAIIATVAFFLFIVAAFAFFSSSPLLGAFFGLLTILAGAFAALNFHNANRARREADATDLQMQEATNRVSMMVAAREAAVRMGGDPEALQQIEQEIRSLGGNAPRSMEEAQRILDQAPDNGESLAQLQQRVKEKRDEANMARSQVNVTMEAVAGLRKERSRLEEQRRQEDWDNIEGNLTSDQAALERMHQEITLLAGQEGLPLASINVRLQSGANFETYSSGQLVPVRSEEEQAGLPDLESLVESTIRATEREIASLDGKLDLVSDLHAQVQVHQEALDVLLVRQQVAQERSARYQTNSPALQVERAREQQTALSQALQSLRESLHQRVKPLGVSFGQAAISNAEVVARKQLESLQITLGSKLMLQEKQENYAATLKERQESLADLYQQLAKYSNTLGSWIVPPNPFAEALVALRSRCQRELEEINEEATRKDLDNLRVQEGACNAKIALCQHEIDLAQERITTLLVQHSRPSAKSYTPSDLVAVWPLLKKYSVDDELPLIEEMKTLESELSHLEEQEMELSNQLGTAHAPLELEQVRAAKEKQERSYLVKKHSRRLVEAVNERILQKMQPRTEYYMQQILPLLSNGRYHDIHLTTEPEKNTVSGGPFQIEVWEAAAGDYVSKSELSGGAADQLSLALRLAFAIAALPRELAKAPGFVILDEPLSSFDRGRTQALMDVVTGAALSKHFEQVILVSHSSAFDPAMFPYHVYLENGLVTESNLPIVSDLPTIEAETLTQDEPAPELKEARTETMAEAPGEDLDDDDENMVTMRVPAIAPRTRKQKK